MQVVLSDEDRSFLEGQDRRHKAPRSLFDRCSMVLLCADDLQSKDAATSAPKRQFSDSQGITFWIRMTASIRSHRHH